MSLKAMDMRLMIKLQQNDGGKLFRMSFWSIWNIHEC